jgi:predicted NBD/HSP70 family sugar kinase
MSDVEEEPERRDPNHQQLLWARFLREVRSRGVTTAPHLQDTVSLSIKRINAIANQMATAGLLDIAADGRFRHRRFALHGDLGAVVGVDLTMDRVRVAVSNFQFQLLNEPKEATRAIDTQDMRKSLAAIAELIAQEVRHHAAGLPLLGVGVGLPGPVARREGAPESDHLLPEWTGEPVAERLGTLLEQAGCGPTQVAVVNDASLGALGVFTRATWGNPMERPEDLIYVRVTHGIGMGLIIKGHLVTGAEGFAGEIGHVRVLPDGPVCVRCNRRGCLEMVSSERAVVETMRLHWWAETGTDPGPRSIREILLAKDLKSREEVGRAGWHLGFVLAAVANVLNPSWIVLGGTLPESPTFSDHMRQTLESFALAQAFDGLRIRSWRHMFDDEFPGIADDVGKDLTPELLGALAVVIDEFADDFLQSRAYDAALVHGR